MEIKTLEELKKAYPDLCLQLEKEAMTKKEKEIKEAMEKEWQVKARELSEGIQKQIEESEEYKAYKAGLSAYKATLVEMVKLLKPYFGEMGEDDLNENKEDEKNKKGKEELTEDQKKMRRLAGLD